MGSKEGLIKMEYEIMHTPVQELALAHDMSESIIHSYIKQHGWEKTEYADESDKLDAVNERMRAMGTMSQASLTPRFLRLQAKVLDQAYNLLSEVKELTDAPMLKIINDVIETHRPHVMGDSGKKGVEDGGITVKIMTQVGGGDQPLVNAVEVSSSAGKTNGIGEAHSGHGKYLS